MYEDMNRKDVIIVYHKNREGVCHLMAQLISGIHKEYSVGEWEEKHWDNNKATLPASQKVIFIGEAGKTHALGIKWRFNKFSMSYGWLSNRAVLDVKLLKIGDIKSFIKYAQQHAEEVDALLKKMAAAGAAGLAMFAGLMIGITSLPVAILIGGPIAGIVYLNKLKKYQYPVLVKEFVMGEGFTRFMEE